MSRASFVRSCSCLLLWASALSAIPQSAVGQRPTVREDAWRFVLDPFAGLHIFGPVRLSVTAVAGVGNGDLDTPGVSSRFFLAIAEPGWEAGRVSLAYAQWMGLRGALILRATALRYWEGRDAAGGELQWIVSVLPLGVRLGLFRYREPRPGVRRSFLLADLAVMY